MSSIGSFAFATAANLAYVAVHIWVMVMLGGRLIAVTTAVLAAHLICVSMNVMLMLKESNATDTGLAVLWTTGLVLLPVMDLLLLKGLNGTNPPSTTPSKT